jgi:hypothetical protein
MFYLSAEGQPHIICTSEQHHFQIFEKRFLLTVDKNLVAVKRATLHVRRVFSSKKIEILDGRWELFKEWHESSKVIPFYPPSPDMQSWSVESYSKTSACFQLPAVSSRIQKPRLASNCPHNIAVKGRGGNTHTTQSTLIISTMYGPPCRLVSFYSQRKLPRFCSKLDRLILMPPACNLFGVRICCVGAEGRPVKFSC